MDKGNLFDDLIKHPFFEGIDFENIHQLSPPVPQEMKDRLSSRAREVLDKMPLQIGEPEFQKSTNSYESPVNKNTL